jgi:hypothetical protein
MNHLGKLSGNSEQEVRSGLSPLGKLAEKFGVAVILVTHYNKSHAADGIQRVGGAMGMVGAVRVAWSFGEDKVDGKMKMVPLKANIAPNTGGLEYQVISEEVEINGQYVTVGRIEFGDVTHSTVGDSLQMKTKDSVVPVYQQCMEWLTEFLADGTPKLQVDVNACALSMGYKPDTLKTACHKLGTVKKTRPDPVGSWYWAIPKKEEKEEKEVE